MMYVDHIDKQFFECCWALDYISFSEYIEIIHPSIIAEWNKLDPEIQNFPSFGVMQNSFLKVLRAGKQRWFQVLLAMTVF